MSSCTRLVFVTVGLSVFAVSQVRADQVERERKRTERMQDENRGTTPRTGPPSVYTRHEPIKYGKEELEAEGAHKAWLERNTPWMYTAEGRRFAQEAREARLRRNESREAAREWKEKQARIDRGQREMKQTFRGWVSQIRVRRTPYQPGQCDYYHPSWGRWTTVSNCKVAVDIATKAQQDLLSRAGVPASSRNAIRIEEAPQLKPLQGISPALCSDLQTLVKSGKRSGGWSSFKGGRTSNKHIKLLDLPEAKRLPQARIYDFGIDEVDIPLFSGKSRAAVEKLIPSAQQSLRTCLEKVGQVFGSGNLVTDGGVIARIGASSWAGTPPYAGQPHKLYLRMVEVSPDGLKLYREHSGGIAKKKREPVDPTAATATGFSPALCEDLQDLVRAGARRGGLKKFRGKRISVEGWRARTYALRNLPEAAARAGSALIATKPAQVIIPLGKRTSDFRNLVGPLLERCVEQVIPVARNTAWYTETGVTIGLRYPGGEVKLAITESTSENVKFYKILTKPSKI